MTEESNGAAVALPATDYTLAIPARPYEPAYVTNEEGFSAEAMLAFRAEGEADLRARLAAAEASRKELREFVEEVRLTGNTRLASMAIAIINKTPALANDAEQKGGSDE